MRSDCCGPAVAGRVRELCRRGFLLRCTFVEMALNVISLPHTNSVAFGAKRTLSRIKPQVSYWTPQSYISDHVREGHPKQRSVALWSD
jgi:hypothetical protein